MYSSVSTMLLALALLDGDGRDLILEAARFARGFGFVLRCDGESVLLSRVICNSRATFSAVTPMW